MKARNIELVSVTARLPIDAKEWLERQALQNVTSLNARSSALFGSANNPSSGR